VRRILVTDINKFLFAEAICASKSKLSLRPIRSGEQFE
jgi:hypothetical protein